MKTKNKKRDRGFAGSQRMVSAEAKEFFYGGPQQTKGGSGICSLDNLRSISRTLFVYGNPEVASSDMMGKMGHSTAPKPGTMSLKGALDVTRRELKGDSPLGNSTGALLGGHFDNDNDGLE